MSESTQNSLRLYTLSDRELWLIPADEIKLPVFADTLSTDPDPYSKPTHVRLTEAVLFSNVERQIIINTVHPYKMETRGSDVIIPYEKLTEFAQRAPGTNPRYYYRGNTQQATDPQVGKDYEVSTFTLSKEATSFIDWVFQQTKAADLNSMRITWRAIQQQALIWLAEQRKPLDMGFVRLFPVPYRKNWKEVLVAACPGLKEVITIENVEERNAEMVKLGFAALLKNGLIAAINARQRFVYWTIEAIEKPEWEKANENYERRRFARLGAPAYAKYWVSACRRAFGGVLEALRQWNKGCRIPCATVDQGSLFGGRVLVPYVPEHRIRALPAPSGDVYAAHTEAHNEPIGREYLEALLGTPPSRVRKVPTLQPEAAHLWNREGEEPDDDVGESEESED